MEGATALLAVGRVGGETRPDDPPDEASGERLGAVLRLQRTMRGSCPLRFVAPVWGSTLGQERF